MLCSARPRGPVHDRQCAPGAGRLPQTEYICAASTRPVLLSFCAPAACRIAGGDSVAGRRELVGRIAKLRTCSERLLVLIRRRRGPSRCRFCSYAAPLEANESNNFPFLEALRVATASPSITALSRKLLPVRLATNKGAIRRELRSRLGGNRYPGDLPAAAPA